MTIVVTLVDVNTGEVLYSRSHALMYQRLLKVFPFIDKLIESSSTYQLSLIFDTVNKHLVQLKIFDDHE